MDGRGGLGGAAKNQPITKRDDGAVREPGVQMEKLEAGLGPKSDDEMAVSVG